MNFEILSTPIAGEAPRSTCAHLETLFDCVDEYNRDLNQRYKNFRHQKQPFWGWYEVRGDGAVTDNWGLVYNPRSGFTPVLLPGFGWRSEHLEFAAAKRVISIEGEAKESGVVGPVIRSNMATNEEFVTDPTCLLAWPGALTFGHWITDMIGRLELALMHPDFGRLRFLSSAPCYNWMMRFFGLYGITKERIIFLDKSTTYRCSKLIVPTIMCHMPGGTLPVEFLGPVLKRHRSAIHHWLPACSKRKMVYLRHTRMTSSENRDMINAREVEKILSELGAYTADPLKITAGDLIAMLNSTDIVVGQDSSALHNLAFANPSRLIVIETQPRANLLHASIQETVGGQISYFRADRSETRWKADISRLETHVRHFLT